MSLKYIIRDFDSICSECSFSDKLKQAIFSHTFHLIIFIRIGQTFSSLPLIGSLLRIFIEYFIRIIFASDISCKSSIGPGFQIQHGHDIVIGADVKIGENCKIFNGVTLGNKDTTKSSFGQQPHVADNVLIGTGSKLLGPITIGNNSSIGANSVVLKSFPSNSVIVGIPAINKNTDAKK